MDWWDWEFFATEVTNEGFVVTDHGPLYGPVTGFSISRDKALDLVLETTSAGDSRSSAPPIKAETVYTATAEVKLASRYGPQAVASGVIPRSYTRVTAGISPMTETRQTSSIHSLQWRRDNAAKVRYIIEWVENMSTRFIWPHSDDVTKKGEKRRRLSSSVGEVVFSVPIDSGGFHSSCIHLFIEGFELFVGLSRAKPEYISKPGFILYKGAPNETERSKIRDCLSFCLGNFLVYLGDTSFDEEWTPVSFTAKSGHALVEEAPTLSSLQPAPLGTRFDSEVTSERLGRMASSLFRNYDAYKLQSVFWNYWHALAAPVHMAAAHFGAAIESLQKTVFSVSGSEAQHKIVADDRSWKDLYAKIAACVREAPLTGVERDLLIKRAQNMNYAPQGIMAERLFEVLSLCIGDLERKVWVNRNRAAHGGGTNAENGIRLIRENKVLRVMMNRMLLAIGNGSDEYYDYYTIGRPQRRLAEPIPDDSGAA